MEQQIIQWIQEHSSFMVPIIFLICFLLLFALGWKGFRRHYREKVHYLNKTAKERFQYWKQAWILDHYYHCIPYVMIVNEEGSIEEYSLQLYRKFASGCRSTYLFFVLFPNQNLIRINMGEDLKFLLSKKELERLLDQFLENISYANFLSIWGNVHLLCKERLHRGTFRSVIGNTLPLSFLAVLRGQSNLKDLDGNRDTFLDDDMEQKCIGITKKILNN